MFLIQGRTRLIRLGVGTVLVAVVVAVSALATVIHGTVTRFAGTSVLTGYACPPAGSCVAVGWTASPDFTAVIVVNGRVKPVHGIYYFTGVACPKKNFCIAVGFAPLVGKIVPITNGEPGPITNFNTVPNAIGCGSADSCWVTGSWNASYRARLVHLVNGKVVQQMSFTDRYFAPEGAVISPPVCSSANSCILVGEQRLHRGPGEVFSLKNGKLRTLEKVPGTNGLSGIACTPSGSCTIVGFRRSGGVVLTLANGRFGPARPLPHGLGGYRPGISDPTVLVGCRSAGRCYAVGRAGSRSVVVPITRGRPGTEQTIEPVISGVSCASRECVIAGRKPANSAPDWIGELFRFF
jgi:hypothetical protein